MSTPGIRKLDYLSFTMKDEADAGCIIEALGLKFLPLRCGHYGYKSACIAESGGINVYFDGFRVEMGVHVQISGLGCRLIEAMECFDSWRDWIGRWLEKGAKVTRIDLAIDDESATVDYWTVRNALEQGTVVTHARKGKKEEGFDIGKPGSEKPTIYAGKRTSETMMRCYDKGQQLGGTSWLRFEFEYKGARAEALARLLVDEGWDAAYGAIRSFIEFKDETHKTTDRTRQRAAQWWVDLVSASKHVIRIQKEVHQSLLKAYLWLKRQAAATIATLLEYEGGDLSWVLELADEGKTKMKERHKMMLRRAGPSLFEATT